jgi:hypothetical protein
MKHKILLFAALFVLFAFKAYSQDIDKDGVPDNMDNCPLTYNPMQQDDDNDQIGNACDCEPSTPSSVKIPAIIIYAIPDTNITAGTSVTFHTVIKSEGTAPVFDWRKNNVSIGINDTVPDFAHRLGT